MTTSVGMTSAADRGAFDFPVGDELRGERATLGRSLLDVQRDLRIKAVYISAIENTDPGVFPNPSFVPGYVRAYARYLGLDPDTIYGRFCADSGFRSPTGLGTSKPAKVGTKAGGAKVGAAKAGGVFRPDFPLAEPRRRGLTAVPLSALGSLVVLAAVLGALGWGGLTVLKNIQRVQFAPVEEAPIALVSVPPVAAPEAPALAAPELTELAKPVAATALAELYRSQELEVPILAPRDGPIAALDPDRVGLLAGPRPAGPIAVAAPALPNAPAPSSGPAATFGAPVVAVDAPAEPADLAAADPAITIVAERAAWVRVYLADKTVIFERILETGETYALPPDLVAPMIWAGNSGSVYVRLGQELRGPLGGGTRAVRDVALEPAAIAERFGVVADVPEAVSKAFDPVEQAAVIR
jgi:cytoskeleton protein RodZ